MRQTRWSRMLRAAAVGLLAAGAFWLFARDRIVHAHLGNPSGLLHISEQRFDRNPLVNERPDLRNQLALENSDGYDGQYFYFMTFDPLVTRYAHRPRSYSRVADAPSYRFGRIGFSWLTRLFSGGREAAYPVAMIALVVGSLGICAALLAVLAMRHGGRSWVGLIVLAIPGFWQTSVLALPEPITLALILAGILLAGSQRWVLAGLALGLAMLVRETSGAIVLAVPTALLFAGRRREALIVTALAFAPVVLWKLYIGWIFYPVEGLRAFYPHPDDVGWPFQGMYRFWAEVVSGDSPRSLVEQRSGVMFSILVMAAAALVSVLFVKRPEPLAAAGLLSALLALTLKFDLVWVYIANAQRLTIDLFATLAILHSMRGAAGPMPRLLTAFWVTAAMYVLFGMTESTDLRRALLVW